MTKQETRRGTRFLQHKLTQCLSYWHHHNTSFWPATENTHRVRGSGSGWVCVCVCVCPHGGTMAFPSWPNTSTSRPQRADSKSGRCPTEMLISCCVVWKGFLSWAFGFRTSWQKCPVSHCVGAGKPSCCNQFGCFFPREEIMSFIN